jgi:hypothetical protein
MKCAIMQPTYLPWSGYFNLMAEADVFVFLDDAQFQKNSWHSRNRIVVNQQPHWVSVPVRHLSLSQALNETPVCDEKKWRNKHARLLQQTYSHHPHSEIIIELAQRILDDTSTNLATLNMRLITWLSSMLGITTPLRQASEMGISGKRTQRLIDLLTALKASHYLSPIGAAEYLNDDGFAELSSLPLEFQSYTPNPYSQYRCNSFLPYLSIVDVIANLGWQATAIYIRQSTHKESEKHE